MTKDENYPKPEHYGDATVPAFGYELIRNELLPELLGKEAASILYWSGRKIARLYPMTSEEEVAAFFNQAGWGNLSLTDRGKNKLVFECQSALIESRIKDHPGTVLFTMEAGFLAQQIEMIHGYIAETYSDIRTGHHKKVIFNVKWDSRDIVESTPKD
ncbi:MAG: YslB family protein [Sporolactobacillus sp.]